MKRQTDPCNRTQTCLLEFDKGDIACYSRKDELHTNRYSTERRKVVDLYLIPHISIDESKI